MPKFYPPKYPFYQVAPEDLSTFCVAIRTRIDYSSIDEDEEESASVTTTH